MQHCIAVYVGVPGKWIVAPVYMTCYVCEGLKEGSESSLDGQG